jgi:uncharacterized protein
MFNCCGCFRCTHGRQPANGGLAQNRNRLSAAPCDCRPVAQPYPTTPSAVFADGCCDFCAQLVCDGARRTALVRRDHAHRRRCNDFWLAVACLAVMVKAIHAVSNAPDSPCQSCGACCASFRVDFSVQELESEGGSVPDGLCVEVTSSTCRMRGTDHSPPRCAALTGKVGEKVACGIYEWRPSPCHELEAGSDGCEKARARHGLPALDI